MISISDAVRAPDVSGLSRPGEGAGHLRRSAAVRWRRPFHTHAPQSLNLRNAGRPVSLWLADEELLMKRVAAFGNTGGGKSMLAGG
jgi:hypothetical protein